jgi:hypothetical protein
MLITTLILSLLLIAYLFYQWGTTAAKEYKRGMNDYQERVKAFAEEHPTLTAEELYQTLKQE